MFTSFKFFPSLVADISTKKNGSMGRAHQVARSKNLQRRRSAFLEKFGLSLRDIVTSNLVHGNNVVVVHRKNAGVMIPNCDALVTGDTNLFLSVTAADCLPIFFFDPTRGVIALAHAGWQGIEKKIVSKVIGVVTTKFHSNPSDVLVAIGPHICVQHYEVQSDVARRFIQYGNEVLLLRDGKQFLDLAKTAKLQLVSRGILKDHIEISRDCTFENENAYYSFRRDKPAQLETMMAIFGIRKKTA